jgi:hypothetical protein
MNYVYYHPDSGKVEVISVTPLNNDLPHLEIAESISFHVPKVVDGKLVEGATDEDMRELFPPVILDRLTKLELKRSLHAINRADVWQALQGVQQADPSTLNDMQKNMQDWMLYGTHLDRNDRDVVLLEQIFQLDAHDLFNEKNARP